MPPYPKATVSGYLPRKFGDRRIELDADHPLVAELVQELPSGGEQEQSQREEPDASTNADAQVDETPAAAPAAPTKMLTEQQTETIVAKVASAPLRSSRRGR